MKRRYEQQIKRLMQALALSGTVNIILMALVVFWVVRERPPIPYCVLKPAEEQTQFVDYDSEALRLFTTLSIEQLITKLSDSELHHGVKQRDLALGCLVTFHHFDLSRALLGRQCSMKKQIIPLSSYEIPLYSDLTDATYAAIEQFAKKERWPLTPEGLYCLLQNTEDQDLKEAFYFTPDFCSVERLFHRSETAVDREDILLMLLDGNWEMLAQFVEKQCVLQDLSSTSRRAFLMSYLLCHSKTAASLLLQTDYNYSLRDLKGDSVALMLSLLPKNEMTQRFAQELFACSQSEAVMTIASHLISPPQEILCSENQVYVVQQGDSLWKIAKRHDVSLNVLIEYNRLDADRFLMPGMSLKIP